MYLGVWQIVYLVINILGLGLFAIDYGKKQITLEQFSVKLIAVAVMTAIIAFGGFFSR